MVFYWEFRAGLIERVCWRDQSSIWRSAGCLQKKRKVRKESAETQDYVSCQQHDMELDNNKSLEEMGFVRSAVSGSSGWREPVRVATRSAMKRASSSMILQPFWWKTTASCTRSTSVGSATTSDGHEETNQKVTIAGWKTTIEQNVSRGRLSAAFGADGFVKRMWE